MKYRLLAVGEIIENGDQYYNRCDNTWIDDCKTSHPLTGRAFNKFMSDFRRPIKSVSRTSTNSRFSKCPHCGKSLRRALPKAADVVGNK